MRITIITIGSRGDVQPFVALALGLQRAGHHVTIATMSDFRELVAGHGVGFAPIDASGLDMSWSNEGRAWIESGQNVLEATRQTIRVLTALTPATQAVAWSVTRDADALIFASAAAVMAGYHLTQKLNVPCFQASLQPVFNPTRSFAIPTGPPAPAFLSEESWLAGTYNWVTHLLGRQVAWHAVRRQTNRWRKEVLDLPALPLSGPYLQPYAQRLPFLHAYSPTVVPKPPDWPDWVHITGYWFLDTPADWQPPVDLVDFLSAGPPPIAIGFGSMSSRDPQALTATVMDALARSGQRGILITGWGSLTPIRSDEIFSIDAIPHDWLLPRVAAVVHHGGAGSTAAGLRAGIPSILVPHFADQFFWAQRIAALGAGPSPIPRSALTAERLAAAIRQARDDQTIRARAAAIGQVIAAEDGVARAVETFHQHLEQMPG